MNRSGCFLTSREVSCRSNLMVEGGRAKGRNWDFKNMRWSVTLIAKIDRKIKNRKWVKSYSYE